MTPEDIIELLFSISALCVVLIFAIPYIVLPPLAAIWNFFDKRGARKDWARFKKDNKDLVDDCPWLEELIEGTIGRKGPCIDYSDRSVYTWASGSPRRR